MHFPQPSFERHKDALRHVTGTRRMGRVVQVVGALLEVLGPAVPVGEMCRILDRENNPILDCVVVGFRENRLLLMPLVDLRGVGSGQPVSIGEGPAATDVGDGFLGRVIDARGEPLDDKPHPLPHGRRLLHGIPPSPLQRKRIREPLVTGVRAIDGLLTCGQGQRMGLFAGSGVGKSVLLGMMARYTRAEINVIALVGERGREVREFIERDLGPEGLARSVVVVATSDQSPMMRLHAALTATAHAEYFRDQGHNVLLMMDSVTRLAMAGREVGLAAGEPPTTKGYTPSVFAFLPQLLERAGATDVGTITGFYTVLVEGDDMDDPIADTLRSILDGHVILSRKLAARHHYPAIDVSQSLSRLMPEVTLPEHERAAGKLREALAIYQEAEDLITVGAYTKGTQPKIDWAIGMMDPINRYLRQEVGQPATFAETQRDLIGLFKALTS